MLEGSTLILAPSARDRVNKNQRALGQPLSLLACCLLPFSSRSYDTTCGV